MGGRHPAAVAGAPPWAVFAVFCCLGAGNCGYQMSQQTMVPDFGERADIAMRLALSTTIAIQLNAGCNGA